MISAAQGKFIVIEGPDGSGKSTLARNLAGLLDQAGKSVYLTAEPSARPVGQLLRRYLTHDFAAFPSWSTLALLFAADRLDHVENEIAPELARGKIVICDRYTLSNMVYQSVLRGKDVSEPEAVRFIRDANEYALTPDIMVVLEVPLETTMARVAARAGQPMATEQAGTQELVHAAYEAFTRVPSPLAHVTLKVHPGPLSAEETAQAALKSLARASTEFALEPR